MSLTNPTRLTYALVLIFCGLGWGSTQPLGKIAASTGHPPFGLIFWQLVTCVVVLGILMWAMGKRLPLHRGAIKFYIIVALLGTLIPNYTFYLSVARLPSGIMSIIISTIPLLAFPLALAVGIDRFSVRRFLGLMLGIIGVALIALPQASLPDPAMAAFLPIALIGPLFYAMENTYVAKRGLSDMDAVQAMTGTSIAGVIMCVVPMLAMGHWFVLPLPPGPAEYALIGSSALHALLYATFIWLASQAGAVFASQSAYLTTASGMVWAMLILGERFSPWIWAAAAVMILGMALVSPREKSPNAKQPAPDTVPFPGPMAE
jgi:drug/metabolite transporter (DMT)-like permease